MKNIIKIIITFSALFVTINLNAQCFNKISAGAIHSSAIKTNGTVWVWGWGGGQLGNSNDFDAYSPIALATGTTWQTVRSNVNNTFAIKQDGTLWGCGGNLYGGMGVGSTVTHVSVPTQIGTASNWKEVAPGDSYSIALKTDNTIWGWGQNDSYQMGNSTCCANQLTPIQIGTATDWKSIGASNIRCSFAIKNNGTLWGWGLNAEGMLGDSSVSARMTPTQHDTDTDWDKMSLGSFHIMVVKTNGTLWTWGSGQYGQTGHDPTTSYDISVPNQIPGNWKAMSAGQYSSMGIKTNGTLWAWGRNEVGQLGDGTTTNRFVPVQIGTATNWESVSSGWFHTLALRTDGSLWVWGGNNDYGQLGNGTTATLALPTQLAVTGCALGSETFLAQNNTLQLGPNPVKNDVTIQYQGLEPVDTIIFYDITGKEVYTIAAIGNNAFMSTFSIAQLQSGMYVVTLKNKNKTVASSKLIKE